MSRSAALKSLATWVDMRVLKEDSEHVFKLLSVAEEPMLRNTTTVSKLGTLILVIWFALACVDTRFIANGADELPPMMSVQQQQAEQMKVYWKVGNPIARSWITVFNVPVAVH